MKMIYWRVRVLERRNAQKRSPLSSTDTVTTYRCVRESADSVSQLLWDGKEITEMTWEKCNYPPPCFVIMELLHILRRICDQGTAPKVLWKSKYWLVKTSLWPACVPCASRSLGSHLAWWSRACQSLSQLVVVPGSCQWAHYPYVGSPHS